MATLARLQARSTFLAHQYYFRNSAVDVFRKKEYDAAVKIQSWFRGCRIRAYLRYLHRVASVIQKCWRGYLGRQHYQLIVKLEFCTMKMNLYNAMAVRIQKRWRGYRIRKYCFNYFYLKEYLKAVSETNDAIREALEEFAEMKEREEKKADLEREEKKRDYQARKMHYLLSTKQALWYSRKSMGIDISLQTLLLRIPGIYNSPFRKDPDPWELRLQKAKPLISQRPKVKQKRDINMSNWLACTSARSLPQSEILPPIDRKQCQGPFRDITEVLEQRYKPLEPTLWMAEPINELKMAREELRKQEWMRNINDNRFLPFSSYHKNKKYIPLMHSSSKYGPNSYGSQHFRDENPKKWICDKDFQTVLPSFDLFSKYGKLYSKAGQII
ncbi:spermatogenesis-associated protein 17 isoform X1 [Neofelis nebulosa]|uniref:spermatogenesis-associated protein 17 isoform X1 n=1 Tax=Neofelis nebulosa TaxID=61452 RepID=UPI00272D98A2|nr:spermatogenesis-associated protein 17 isoform X1 [Neofelis nebulosa]XP_058557356.1 spermatogenesis-associated protein 17 isoform X1 [Neofelis nebulosa]XP_058557357.1 spermatogenesis-associated protein 17 isoform X1 [Neofelis nebulosa]